MRISEQGVDLIKSFEGVSLTAYPDPATGGDPITIGYGHTGPEVYLGLKITQQQADQLLEDDLLKFERGVTELVKVPISQNEFDALVSFAFNLGLGNLKSSTLLRLLNENAHHDEVAAQFLRWDRANGKQMAGLTRRRKAEAAMFLGQ